MTTETRSTRKAGGVSLLVRAALLACLAGLCLAAVGGLVSGSAAASGALFGAALTALILFGGSVVVDLVATVLPSASLLVAMLTYVLQLVSLGVILLAVERSPEFLDHFARIWLGTGVITVTGAWMVAQIVLTTRRRIPAFEHVEPVPR